MNYTLLINLAAAITACPRDKPPSLQGTKLLVSTLIPDACKPLVTCYNKILF